MAKQAKAPGHSLIVRAPHIKESGEQYPVELDEDELRRLLSDVGDYRTAGQGLKADLVLARHAENVSVRGVIETWVTYSCSRCLADTTERIRVDLHWTFLPVGPYRASARPEEEVELTAEDLEVSFYEGDEIDLSEVIRESLVLELSAYPVCVGGCPESIPPQPDVEEAEIDPRWLPLLDLKKQQQS